MPSVLDLAGVAPARWLVTGAAGFIGSNLTETLLRAGHSVVALDNLATGHLSNVDDVRVAVGPEHAQRLRFLEGDICDDAVCADAVADVDYVLHQAALGSVPRSIDRPLPSFAANVDGFMRILDASRRAGVRRFVYASSSSVYGDHPDLPKREMVVGRVLSPYAATKSADELFAGVFARCYGMACVGLRYFNVFGRRQDPEGAYAAVIPRWIDAMLRSEAVRINGDGETSRDFCYIDNAVQANLRAALVPSVPDGHRVYNVAVGARTSLNELFALLRELLQARDPTLTIAEPVHAEFRAGDVRHSLADISLAQGELGYRPTHDIRAGLVEALDWYVRRSAAD
ncbi:MAG: SDR family oxidoreductase [Burkholderiaceae bacterium]